jgi:hypothetical protein
MIVKRLRLHSMWLEEDSDGEQLVEHGDALIDADLRGADLQYTDLRGADLRGTSFAGSTGITYAACTWSGHGELLGMIVGDSCVYLCGGFAGSEEELRALIESEPLHRVSRTLALGFVQAQLLEELTNNG